MMGIAEPGAPWGSCSLGGVGNQVSCWLFAFSRLCPRELRGLRGGRVCKAGTVGLGVPTTGTAHQPGGFYTCTSLRQRSGPGTYSDEILVGAGKMGRT